MKIRQLISNWFKYLVYISLIFVVVALVRADYLVIPKIYQPGLLAVSFLFLFLGFLFQGLNWFFVLKKDYPVSWQDAIISVGLSIFAKYIPGKILVIIGKAGYVQKKYAYSGKGLIMRSLDAQFIVLWTGIIVGSIGLLFSENSIKWALPLLAGWVFLTLLIFTNIFHNLLKKLIKRLTKKNLSIPFLSFNELLKVLPVFLVYWILFTVAFYFFAAALAPIAFDFRIAFGFPLAATLGIMLIIAPGGIGFREGILVVYLTMLNIDLQDATTISVASRLWFLVGEIVLFIFAFILNLSKNKQNNETIT